MSRPASAVVAAATALIFVGTSPASASVTQRHSAIFAGYAVSRSGLTVRQVTATFVVPTITCENAFSGVGPSVLVYSDVDARTGSHLTSGAGIGVACEDGGPFYESVILVDDHAYNDLTLHAGDTVDVTVRAVPQGTTVSIDDVTAGVAKTRTGSGQHGVQTFVGDNSVVVDGQGGKLDPFSTTTVSDVLVNTRPLGTQSPYRFQWVKRGRTLVSASPLHSRDGFTLTFRASD